MKVICKCCFKPFDYDMYMGLCPKCGRVYRRGKGVYSEVERDMVGDFHLHADDGGLNRGIDGVVYNQGSSDLFRTQKNGFDEGMDDFPSITPNKPIIFGSPTKPANPANGAAVTRSANVARPMNPAGNMAGAQNGYRPPKPVNPSITFGPGADKGYFAANHGTKINQPVVKGNKKGNGFGATITLIIIIIAILMSIFEQ